MTTLMVNINDEQEERVLLAFLNSLKYSYTTESTKKASLIYRKRKFCAEKGRSIRVN